MAEKSFVLLSLKGDKAKNLSKALSNETCRKILDYLAAKGDATETQISTDLKVPISTVHYNMKLLADNGLVTMNEYHYSEKGKEVIHYKMRNRYIVIAPDAEDEKSVMDKLKGMLPAVITLGIGTVIVGAVEFWKRNSASFAAPMLKAATLATGSGAEDAVNPAPQLMARAAEAAPYAAASGPHFTLWFLLGGVFTLICLLLWNFTEKK
jgi:DNA-binding transcriptional ArsR family regulator